MKRLWPAGLVAGYAIAVTVYATSGAWQSELIGQVLGLPWNAIGGVAFDRLDGSGYVFEPQLYEVLVFGLLVTLPVMMNAILVWVVVAWMRARRRRKSAELLDIAGALPLDSTPGGRFGPSAPTGSG